jgi:protein-S-isoprenylcysteine O-methyltransferase Ste14
MHHFIVGIGNFFFRYRNMAFPLVIVGLFMLAAPPRQVFGSEALEHAKDVLALLLAAAGLTVRASVIGYAYIKRGGRGKRVYAADLVTHGMFGLCRNPLYLGNLLICLGTFLMHGNPYVLIAGTAFYLFVYEAIVRAEEVYLSEKFGDQYRAYCSDVARWLPNIAGFRAATAGATFNLRRVIVKDYTTIATTVALLALTEAYEYWIPAAAPSLYVGLLAAVALVFGMFALIVKQLKKRGILVEVS